MKTTFYSVMIGMIMMTSASLWAQCPTVFCQDLNTAFMPDACMVEVWSKDFVNKVDMGDIPVDDYWISFEEDSLVMNRIFRSENGNIQTVDIWVAQNPDGTGCKSRCEVILKIRDNSGDCPTEEFLVCPIEANPWCGYAVLSCSADKPDDLVASIIDVRRNDIAPRGDDWAKPTNGGDTLNVIGPKSWTLDNLGMIFGMARKVETGEIFMAASDVYAFDYSQLIVSGFISVGFPPPTATGSAGPAGIYRTMFGTDEDAITVNPIIFTNANQYLEASEAIGGSFISNFGNFDGPLTDPAGATNQFETFDSSGVTTGNGLGNITYDRRSNHLFASNLEDGKIYSINCSTNRITDVFDPFDAYDHSIDGPGIVDQLNRVWAVAIRQCSETTELYFSRSSENTTEIDHISPRFKKIYKINISAGGRFIQEDGEEDFLLEVTQGNQNKITDISFDISCNRMLLAERGHPHEARVFEFVYNGSTWDFEKPIYVGIYDPIDTQQPNGKIVGSSTGGGAAYGAESNSSFTDAECDRLIWSTVHCGNPIDVPGRCDVYGLQGISADGNDTLTSNATDIYVGLQVDPGSNVLRLKNNLGDVDIFNCCCPGEPMNPINTGTAIVSGNVYTPVGMYEDAAEVSIQSENMVRVVDLSKTGTYIFEDLEMYKNYKVYPKLTEDGLSGISTLDAVLIQQHILGIREFNNDFQYIAADVNGSGNVSAQDLVELRKYLLGKKEFNDNTWKTIDKTSYDQRSSIQEFLEIQNLQMEAIGADFVAVKSGDVNFDNNRYLQGVTRSNNYIQLIADNSKEKYTLSVSSDVSLRGMQITFSGINGSLEASSELFSVEEANYHIKEGNATFSISLAEAIQVESGTVVLALHVDHENDLDIQISSTGLAAEWYDENYVVRPISVSKGGQDISQLSVRPNPVSETTSLYFYANKVQDADVQIYDNIGRIISSRNVKLEKGDNLIGLDTESLFSDNSSGVYLLRLKTDDEVFIERLVKVD